MSLGKQRNAKRSARKTFQAIDNRKEKETQI